MKHVATTLAAILLTSTATMAMAEENMITAPNAVPPAFEEIATVNFITGGIGKEEMEMFQTQEDQYSLRIKATLKEGHYISDVVITVDNKAKDTLLRAEMDGPLLYADLEPGTYKVYAEWEGKTDTRTVNIPKGGYREIFFRFEHSAEDGLDQRGVE